MPNTAKSFAAVLLAVLAITFNANPADAHTGFESSSPADGDLIDEPVSEIRLTFSGEATPAGEGFIVLDPTGTVREPDEITTSDNLTWILRFDEPLAGGEVGVRWMVAAPDAHPIDGSFSFTVTAPTPAPTEEPEPPADGAAGEETKTTPTDAAQSDTEATAEETDPIPAPTAPDSAPSEQVDRAETAPAAPADSEPVDSEPVDSEPVDSEPVDSEPVDSEPVDSEPVDSEPVDSEPVDSEPVDSEPVDIESFLDTGDAKPTAGSTVAAVARILSVLGAVLVIGGAAFAAFGLRGDPSDLHAVLRWVRRGGALLVIGAITEAATMTAALAGQWSALTSPSELRDALWSSAGLAIGLRSAGGLLTASKTGMATKPASAVGDPVIVARRLASVGGGRAAAPPVERGGGEPFVYAEDHTWDHRLAVGGLLGIVLVAVSFTFDGHTASEGPRWLHAVANLTHVTSAAIWAGGVAMLALTIHRRRNNDRPTQALQLAVRFSVIATIALLAAGIAGAVLSVIVIDSVSDLWSTPWGRLLTLKVTLVAVAASGGAYNHRVIVPALDQAPNDQATIDRFRTAVTVEAVALLVVAVITAFLIAASTT